MAKVFMRVLARRLGRFSEDKILTEARRLRVIGDVWISGWCQGVCVS